MADETIVIGIQAQADLTGFDRAEKAVKDLGRATSQTSGQMQRAAKSTGQMSSGLQAADRFAKSFGGRIGESSEKIRNFGEGVGLLGAAGGPLAAATLAIGAAGLAFAGLTAAVVGTVMAANDAVDRLEEIGEVSAEQAESIRRANTALGAMGIAADTVTVAIAERFAPAVERVSTLIVALGLMLSDTVEATGSWARAVEDAYESITAPLRALDDALLTLQVRLGIMTEEQAEFNRAIRDATGPFDFLTDGLGDLEVAMGDYLPRAQEVIGSLDEMGERGKAAADAAAESLKAWETAISGFITDEWEARWAQEEEAVKRRAENEKAITDAILKENAARVAANQQAANAERATDEALAAFKKDIHMQIAATALAAIGDQIKNQRLKAVFDATVAGAQLAITASAPPPAGVGFPAGAIAAAALTATQIARIAAAPAPKFHMGLDAAPIERRGAAMSGMGPGERMINAQVGEVVATAEQVREMTEGGSMVVVQMDSRLYELQARRSQRMGALRDKSRSTGQDRYVRGR